MNLRDRVKHILKILGHAMGISLHERLDHTDRQLDIVIEQNNALARTLTALLQSSIHLVRTQAEVLQSRADIDKTLLDTNHMIEQTHQAFLDGLNALEYRQKWLEAQNETLMEKNYEFLQRLALAHTAASRFEPVLASGGISDQDQTDPESRLIEFLYSYLPSRKAFDVGARVGDRSQLLLDSGYEVYAFEPDSAAYERLVNRLGDKPGFHPYGFALGASDRSLADVHREKLIPGDIALASVDTKGSNMEVIRGMGDHRYPVVVTGFSDALETVVDEMRLRDYFWHLVLYRRGERREVAFYANRRSAGPESRGAAFFFLDFEIFRQALAWCAAVLPQR